MSRTIAIEPKRPISATKLFAGSISFAGSLASVAGFPEANVTVGRSFTGQLLPVGSLAGVASGPSLVTVEQLLSGFCTPAGSFAEEIVETPPVDPVTREDSGFLRPTGEVVGEASGPSLVTIFKSVVGSLGLSGDVTRSIDPNTVTLLQLLTAMLSPVGSVSGIASGPSIETKLKDVSGSITPAGTVTDEVIDPPATTLTEDLDGTITPAGTVTSEVSGPSIVTLTQDVDGTITPAGDLSSLIPPSTVTVLKSIAGTITPAGARSAIVSGPSLVTIPRSVGGSITPAGARSAIVIAPPVTFFSQAVIGVITPVGSLSSVVSGPSLVTKTKAIGGLLLPVGAVARATTGPSLVTIPKTIQGVITPAGTVARQVTNNPQILTKAVAGTITPVGSVASATGGGTPVTSNPLYASMGNWDTAEFDRAPAWAGVTFTAIPSTTAACKAQLDAMRARGMKGGFGFIQPLTFGDAAAGGGFTVNMTKYRGLVDRIAAISGIQTYIDDGTFTLVMAGDELHHNKWNGTIPPNTRKAMVQYIKQVFPTIETAFRMPSSRLTGSELPTGGWGGLLTYGWGQYMGPDRTSPRGVTPLQYYNNEIAALAAVGVGFIAGANWWNGGDGSSGLIGPQTAIADGAGTFWVQSPQEIRACIDAAISLAAVKYFMYWTDAHNSGLSGAADMLDIQNRPDYQAAFLYAKTAGLARGSTGQSQTYYTSSGFTAAPNPPSIALGRGVRDSLTGHKVFRLVDGARTMTGEYSALNADNSRIYYIKGNQGFIAQLIWNTANSDVQITGEVQAYGAAGPFGLINGWIWDRSSPNLAYFVGTGSPPALYRRDVRLGTTITVKNFSQDPSFISYWSARGVTPSRLSLVRSDRIQENFCARVMDAANVAVGAVVYNRFTAISWNYQAPAGKSMDRVYMDDTGLYLIVTFTDSTWQVGKLGSPGLIALSAVVGGAPVGFDMGSLAGSQRAFVGDGQGLRSWLVDPIASAAATVYSHPQRTSKVNLYNKGKASLQSYNDRTAYMTYYDATISTAWQLHSGSIYKINWASEKTAQTYKLDPEAVRQGKTQLTKVSSLANLTAAGQWFYNSTQQVLYVRTTDSTNPSTKRMVVFDWRFGMEEIVMTTISGTLVGRLCRHFSYVGDAAGTDIDACRGALMSYDGSRVVFGTNWGGGTVGIYCVLTDPNA